MRGPRLWSTGSASFCPLLMPLGLVLQGRQVFERGRSSLYSCCQVCIFVTPAPRLSFLSVYSHFPDSNRREQKLTIFPLPLVLQCPAFVRQPAHSPFSGGRQHHSPLTGLRIGDPQHAGRAADQQGEMRSLFHERLFLQVTAAVCIRKENHRSSAQGECLPISKNQVFLGVIPGHSDLIFLE